MNRVLIKITFRNIIENLDINEIKILESLLCDYRLDSYIKIEKQIKEELNNDESM